MTGPETQNQTEYIEGKNNSTNAEKEADYIVIEGRDPKTADEINKTMYAKFKEIMESTPRGKKLIQDGEAQMNKINDGEKHPQSSEKDNNKKEVDNIIGEANYLILGNINEIKVHLFGVDPAQVYLAVNDGKYTDSERIKQVIKALKEPGITINGSGSKSIQDLQILMGKTLGIRLNPDGKFGKDTFGAMKKYLSRETVTAKNANEANNTRVNASDVMFGNEKLPIQNEDGKNFVEIDGKKYYEYKKGMNGLGYENGINKNGLEYTYIGNYVNGNREGKGTFTRADGDKYEGEFKNDNYEGIGTYICANGDKYEGEFKEDHAEGRGTRTWANGNSVEGTFTKTDKSMFGLKTPTKFIDNSGEYKVVQDNGLLKVVSEGKYEGKYISVETGEFVDTPSTNHDSDQDNDQADNPKDNNVDNHASKQREQFKKYQKLNEEIQKLRNGGSYEYKINDDIIFTFTKEKCILNDSGKEITFYNTSKKGFRYRIKPNKYITIKPNFIDIYDISKNMNKLYYQDGSGRKKFEGYTDKYGNPKEGIMTYNNGSKFEGNFIVGGTLKEGERHNVSFKEDDFWN